jgi:Sugar (and other) transporter.
MKKCVLGLAWILIPQEWTLEIPWIDINYSPWRVFIITGAIPSFLAAIMLTFLLPESPKYLFSVGKENDALSVLRYVFSMNTGQPPDEYPVSVFFFYD